jgi:hypothetical protein
MSCAYNTSKGFTLNTETAINTASHPTSGSPGRRHFLEERPKEDTAATVAIASISKQDWYISRTHGVYHIPACAMGEPYSLLLLTSRGDVIDLGDNRRFPFTISAREIAADLLQDLHDHGLFVCAGPRPSEEELAAALARRDAYYQRLIAEGDVMWARGHSFREISDLHRRATLELGIEREWAYVPMKMNECPACGEKVKSGVAVCKHCGAILDAEKAAKHGLGNRIAPQEKRDTDQIGVAIAEPARTIDPTQ